MSWVLRYEVELEAPLKPEREHLLEGYGYKLSEHSSGFVFELVKGRTLLRGATTMSGDWRTVDDVSKVLANLLRAELDFNGPAFVIGLYGQGEERVAVDALDLDDVQKKLIALWGSVEVSVEADEGEAAPKRRDAVSAAPSRKVEKLLASARADFELWKRASGGGSPE